MKILHLNDRAVPGGGVEVYLQGLLPALERQGHATRLFAGADAFSDSSSLKECLRSFQPDIIHLHNGVPRHGRHTVLENFPLIKTVHVYNTVCPAGTYHLQRSDTICNRTRSAYCWASAYVHRCNSLRPWVIARTYQESLAHSEEDRFADHLLTASAYVRERLIQNGYDSQKVSVLPYAIQLPEPVRASLPEPSLRNGYVLFVGRLYPEKGVSYLLQAMQSAKISLPLVVMGDGSLDYRMALEKEAQKRLPGQVHWIGWKEGSEKDLWLAHARVLALPSVWPEPFGIVGLEAMAFQKPVVAFDVGGIRDWLEDQTTGCLVPAGDVEKFGAALQQCVGDIAQSRRWGEAGREHVRAHYTYESHLPPLLALYKKVCA